MKKNKVLLSFITLIILITSFVFPNKSMATSWAFPFVVWDDYIYVVSEEKVTEIDKEIGQVTTYSDMESYPGNFSNTFGVGTKYFSIKGINTNEAIAIKESSNNYIKANREGRYEVRSTFDGYFDGQQGIIKIVAFSIIGIITVFFFNRFLKKKRRGRYVRKS